MPDLPADAGRGRPCLDLGPDEPGAGSESSPPPPMRVVVQGGWGPEKRRTRPRCGARRGPWPGPTVAITPAAASSGCPVEDESGAPAPDAIAVGDPSHRRRGALNQGTAPQSFPTARRSIPEGAIGEGRSRGEALRDLSRLQPAGSTKGERPSAFIPRGAGRCRRERFRTRAMTRCARGRTGWPGPLGSDSASARPQPGGRTPPCRCAPRADDIATPVRPDAPERPLDHGRWFFGHPGEADAVRRDTGDAVPSLAPARHGESPVRLPRAGLGRARDVAAVEAAVRDDPAGRPRLGRPAVPRPRSRGCREFRGRQAGASSPAGTGPGRGADRRNERRRASIGTGDSCPNRRRARVRARVRHRVGHGDTPPDRPEASRARPPAPLDALRR